MAMFRYDPPGNIDDLEGRPTREAFLDAWDERIACEIRREIDNLASRAGPDYVPHPLFFSEKDHPAQSTGIPVPWNAFPLRVRRKFAGDRKESWAYLDTLQQTDRYSPVGGPAIWKAFRPQDEYCEWHWYKDGPYGERIVFTAEGPEYWMELARRDIDRVVELYQKYVSPEVRKEDLLLTTALNWNGIPLEPGDYDPYNVWNTERGIMHLTQGNNTLGAEINLAARATVLRRDHAGNRITDARRLISSSAFGSPDRSSDPNIGQGVNLTAVPDGGTKALSITLANPVGLYMDEPASRLTDADGRPLAGWFRFERGVKGKGLMAILEPPAGDTRTLADAFVDGERLESGAQVAGLIQMVIYAATADLGAPMPPMDRPIFRACVAKGTDLTNLSQVNVEDVIPVKDTCDIHGWDEAFPDIFETPAPLVAMGRATRLTRDA